MSSSSSAPPSRWSVNSMIAGAGGGLVASIATCPLDVIKTKLQAQRFIQGQPGYLGIIDTIKYIGKTDGFRGYYRGLGPTIFGYLPTWAIYFSVYDGVKTYFGEAPLGEETHERLYPAAQPKGYQPVMREHPWSLHILSAMGAGMASTVCTTPLWVIKTRFMTQAPGEIRYRHTLDAARTIYRTEGLSAFYRGLLPSLLGITHVTVQFPLYEHLKIIARDGDGPLPTQSILLCSAASKMVASIVTYPHEVIRTRLQTQRRPIEVDAMSSDGMVKRHSQYGSLWQTVESLVRKEGWSGLYKGLSINLLRTVPNSAVTMLTYELLMRQLSHGARTA